MTLTSNQVWLVIALSSLISFGLRALPFIAGRWTAHLSPRVQGFFHLAGYALIGSLMSETVFRPLLNADGFPFRETFLGLGLTVFAFAAMRVFQRQVIVLLISFGLFVLLRGVLIPGA